MTFHWCINQKLFCPLKYCDLVSPLCFFYVHPSGQTLAEKNIEEDQVIGDSTRAQYFTFTFTFAAKVLFYPSLPLCKVFVPFFSPPKSSILLQFTCRHRQLSAVYCESIRGSKFLPKSKVYFSLISPETQFWKKLPREWGYSLLFLLFKLT